MTDAEIDRLLGQTWEDRRVSRSERRALKEVLAEHRRADQARHQLRARAFTLARQFADQVGPEASLEWLEGVVKALWPASDQGHRPAPEAHFSPDGDLHARVERLFDSAKRRVDVCVFTITDDRISRAIAAAHRRGVQIRVLSDDHKSGDRGSDVEALAELGVAVRIDRSEHHMHHKFAIFDERRLLNGSFNWTRSASEYNFENLTVTSDPALIGPFAKEFEALWGRGARLCASGLVR